MNTINQYKKINLKIFSFNLEKHTSIHQLNSFFIYIKSKKYDIITLTEFDIKNRKHFSKIKKFLKALNFTLTSTNYKQRSTILYNHTKVKILNQKPISKYITPNSDSHFYICDATFSINDSDYIISSIYAPAFRSAARNKYHNLSTHQFMTEFVTALKNFKENTSPQTNIILTGDWNTPGLDSFRNDKNDNEFHLDLLDLSFMDAYLIGNNKRRNKNFTNIGTNKTNNRLDRFYVDINIARKFKIQYNVLDKCKCIYSTHHPIELKLILPQATDKSINKDCIRRKRFIPNYIMTNSQYVKQIF